MLKRRQEVILFIIGIFIIGIDFIYGKGIPCLFYKLTGLYCPGCGITRSVVSLLQLDIYQAFRYNMLFIILLPFILAYVIYKIIFKGDRKIPNLVWYIMLVLTIFFGIFRNIPYFSFLAPTLIV